MNRVLTISLCLAVSAVSAQPWQPANPPAAYQHYHGKIAVHMAPTWQDAQSQCAARGIEGIGCQWWEQGRIRKVGPEMAIRDDICHVIVYPGPGILAHEKAHCMGWVHNGNNSVNNDGLNQNQGFR